MDAKVLGLNMRRRTAAEARGTGQAVGVAGAAVAVLSAAAGGDTASTMAGLVVMVGGALTAVGARERMGRLQTELVGLRARRFATVPSLRRSPVRYQESVAAARLEPAVLGGTGGGNLDSPAEPTAVMDQRTLASLWELGLQFDLRRALRRIGGGRPGFDLEGLARSSVLLPGTVIHAGSGQASERIVVCMPDMLVLLRDEDLRSGGRVALPQMTSAREFESCSFWLPEDRNLHPGMSGLVYASSPDGEIYMVVGLRHREPMRIQFRCTRWPEGPVRERLWEEFERLARLVVAGAVGQGSVSGGADAGSRGVTRG